MRKKILIICPGPIYPIKMGSKIRMFNFVKGLSRDHEVDVIAKVPGKEYLSSEYSEPIKKICNEYYPVMAPNKENIIKRAFYTINFWFENRVRLTPSKLFYFSNTGLVQKIAEIANSKKYDIINCEYWYSCAVYKHLTYRPYFALDTHDINFEKHEMDQGHKNQGRQNCREIEKYKDLELEHTGLNDLIISVSESDFEYFGKVFSEKSHIKIPIGQDLSTYLNYSPPSDDDKNILFYGGMGSAQNIKAFFRLFNDIFPRIKSKIPDAKLIVLGANPTEEIKKLHDGKNIHVLGYVEDIREWISKAKIMILPLDIAAGFRTRVVEVMAMGVPVIGTHNALDSIEMTSGVHGYVTDSDEEMAERSVQLLNDSGLRRHMSKECRKFVAEKYSIEATYGKLSEYYMDLNTE